MVSRSGFILSSRTSSRLRLFSEFLFLKTYEQNGMAIVVARNVGRVLKSNVSSLYQLPKIYVHFQTKKKHLYWTLIHFILKHAKLFLQQLYPLHSSHMLLNRKKKSENSLFVEEVCEDEIKPERNITHLNLSGMFDYPTFYVFLWYCQIKNKSIFSTYMYMSVYMRVCMCTHFIQRYESIWIGLCVIMHSSLLILTLI